MRFFKNEVIFRRGELREICGTLEPAELRDFLVLVSRGHNDGTLRVGEYKYRIQDFARDTKVCRQTASAHMAKLGRKGFLIKKNGEWRINGRRTEEAKKEEVCVPDEDTAEEV